MPPEFDEAIVRAPMLTETFPVQNPIEALLSASETAVLAVIAGVDGPSYRPVGAMMAVLSRDEWAGTLSSGCIESDIALHALEVAEAGQPRLLRYGRGSPFVDIQLPCGGGLDILLLPRPDREMLAKVVKNGRARRPCALRINLDDGDMSVVSPTPTSCEDQHLTLLFEPGIRFLVFGKGPEASTFAALVQSAGYSNLLLSPDVETLEAGEASGCETCHLVSMSLPIDLGIDDRTAVVLFFHDHDWEPPILAGALDTTAFYIGAQGSQRARDERLLALEMLGVERPKLDRLHGPVGLIPSARDAGTLAVSVLAEVLAKAMARTK